MMGNFKWVKCVCSMLFIAFLFLLFFFFFFFQSHSDKLAWYHHVPVSACVMYLLQKGVIAYSVLHEDMSLNSWLLLGAIIMCIFCIVAINFIFYVFMHLFIHYVFLFFSVKVTYGWRLSDCRWQSCCWLYLRQTLERALSLHCSGKTNDRLVLEVSAEQHTNIQKC